MKNFYFALAALFVLIVFSCVLFQEEKLDKSYYLDPLQTSFTQNLNLSVTDIILAEDYLNIGDDIELEVCGRHFDPYICDNSLPSINLKYYLTDIDSINWNLESDSSSLGWDDAVDGFESEIIVIPSNY